MKYIVPFIGLLAYFVCLNEPVYAASAPADLYATYRDVIDNYAEHNEVEIDASINSLSGVKTNDVEKDYLLGMLYFIRGFNHLNKLGSSGTVKTIADGMKNESVARDFQQAENNYLAVEESIPGYKYIYCKLAEMYRYSLNENGLRNVTLKVGSAKPNERTNQCKVALEDFAEQFAQNGYASYSMVIYKAAIDGWKPYPKYMLQAVGDIENALGHKEQALIWWQRCAQEVKNPEFKKSCQSKAGG